MLSAQGSLVCTSPYIMYLTTWHCILADSPVGVLSTRRAPPQLRTKAEAEGTGLTDVAYEQATSSFPPQSINAGTNTEYYDADESDLGRGNMYTSVGCHMCNVMDFRRVQFS